MKLNKPLASAELATGICGRIGGGAAVVLADGFAMSFSNGQSRERGVSGGDAALSRTGMAEFCAMVSSGFTSSVRLLPTGSGRGVNSLIVPKSLCSTLPPSGSWPMTTACKPCSGGRAIVGAVVVCGAAGMVVVVAGGVATVAGFAGALGAGAAVVRFAGAAITGDAGNASGAAAGLVGAAGSGCAAVVEGAGAGWFVATGVAVGCATTGVEGIGTLEVCGIGVGTASGSGCTDGSGCADGCAAGALGAILFNSDSAKV